jgi:hypothetical protein
MKTEKVLEVVLAGVVTGLTLGVGYALSQKLMGKFGSKEVVVVNEKSGIIGGVGGRKVAGRKSCDMGNGEYILVAAGTPCTSVGGSEVR